MTPFADWELRILKALDGPLPIETTPFATLAARAGVSEEKFLDRVRAWVADGTIRRFGARIKHHAIGFTANGMSVWCVEPCDIERVAHIMCERLEVSHCYARPPQPGWPYNVFAMIHGTSRDEVENVARSIAAVAGISEYCILFSAREFKKSTPRYFADLAETALPAEKEKDLI